MPARDSDVIRRYLEQLQAELKYIDFRAFSLADRGLAIEIDDMFVPQSLKRVEDDPNLAALSLLLSLRSGDPCPECGDGNVRARDRHFRCDTCGCISDPPRFEPGDQWTVDEMDTNRPFGRAAPDAPTLSLLVALERSDRTVILGDPGTGKTTLVKWLARRYATRRGAGEDVPADAASRVPIVLSVGEFGSACAKDDSTCLAYIKQRHNEKARGLGDALADRVAKGECVILFDGLDEIPAAQDRTAAARQVEALMAKHPGNRYVVTSRIYGYEQCRIRQGADHFELQSLDDEQLGQYAHRWHRGLERFLHGSDARESAAAASAERMLEQIRGRAEAGDAALLGFARNPLLLAILCVMQWQGTRLPDRRVELYDEALTILIERWNRIRAIGGVLEGRELDANETMAAWAPVAKWMHENRPTGAATREDILAELTRHLTEDEGWPAEEARRTAESYLSAAAEQACLLLERGQGAFGFLHQTFQEYLAAQAIATPALALYDRAILDPGYAYDPRWREVLLLAVGYIGIITRNRDAAAEFVDRVSRTTDLLEPYTGRHLLLALEILLDRPGIAATVRLQCYGQLTQHVARQVRRAGAQLLAKSPAAAAQAQDALLILMGDGNTRVGVAAANALLSAGERTAEAQQALVRIIEDRDSDPAVRVDVARALLSAGERTAEAQQALVRIIEGQGSTSDARFEATRALLSAGERMAEAQEALVRIIEDRDSDAGVRTGVARALLSAGALTAEAQQALVRIIEDPDSGPYWRHAANALLPSGELTAEAQQALVRTMEDRATEPRLRIGLASTLLSGGVLTAEAQQALVRTMEDRATEPGLRTGLASALLSGGVRTAEAQQALGRIIEDRDSRPHVRMEAASALLSAGEHTAEAQQALVRIIEDRDSDPDVRVGAASALLSAGERTVEAEQALVRTIEDRDSGPYVRMEAASALLSAGEHTAEAQQALVRTIEDRGSNSRLRTEAARALLSAAELTAEAQLGLVRIIGDPDRDSHARNQAARALLSAGERTAEAQQALVRIIEDRASNSRLRNEAVRALLSAGEHVSEAEQGLVRIIEDRGSNSRLRTEAARALVETGAHGAVVGLKVAQPRPAASDQAPIDRDPERDDLLRVLESAPDAERREAVSTLLRGYPDDNEVQTAALRALRADPDEGVRTAVLRHIRALAAPWGPALVACDGDASPDVRQAAADRLRRLLRANEAPEAGRLVEFAATLAHSPEAARVLNESADAQEPIGELREAFIEALLDHAERLGEGDSEAAGRIAELWQAYPWATVRAALVLPPPPGVKQRAGGRKGLPRFIRLPEETRKLLAEGIDGTLSPRGGPVLVATFDLFARLFQYASSDAQARLLQQLDEGASPPAEAATRVAALSALGGCAPHQDQDGRSRTARVLWEATKDKESEVCRTAQLALRLLAPALQPDERDRIDRHIPALSELA